MYVCFILPLGLQAAKNYFLQDRNTGKRIHICIQLKKKLRRKVEEKLLLNPV
jgi:hypothetical protein